MFKATGQPTGRVKFSGTTPFGAKISGYFFRIKKNNLQIKSGEKWHKVNAVFLSRVEEKNA